MSRISIDVTPEEHQKLKAVAALKGMSIKDYVIERTLGDNGEDAALQELEAMLDKRIAGKTSKRTARQIFDAAARR